MVNASPGVMDHFSKQLLELLLIQMLIQGPHVDSWNASTLTLLHSHVSGQQQGKGMATGGDRGRGGGGKAVCASLYKVALRVCSCMLAGR